MRKVHPPYHPINTFFKVFTCFDFAGTELYKITRRGIYVFDNYFLHYQVKPKSFSANIAYNDIDEITLLH